MGLKVPILGTKSFYFERTFFMIVDRPDFDGIDVFLYDISVIDQNPSLKICYSVTNSLSCNTFTRFLAICSYFAKLVTLILHNKTPITRLLLLRTSLH